MTQIIKRLEDVYHLKVMSHYLVFRFCKEPRDGYKEYRVNNKGVSTGFALKNGHKLYWKDKV